MPNNIVTKTKKDITAAMTINTNVEADDSGGFEVDTGSQSVDKALF